MTGKKPLLDEALPEFERVLIRAALKRTQGHRQEAAKLLGWGRNTLTRKLKELGMNDVDHEPMTSLGARHIMRAHARPVDFATSGKRQFLGTPSAPGRLRAAFLVTFTVLPLLQGFISSRRRKWIAGRP